MFADNTWSGFAYVWVGRDAFLFIFFIIFADLDFLIFISLTLQFMIQADYVDATLLSSFLDHFLILYAASEHKYVFYPADCGKKPSVVIYCILFLKFRVFIIICFYIFINTYLDLIRLF